MHKVLVTGITGFLGSHIAEMLIQYNVQVIGLTRPDSDTWRCKNFQEKILWVDLDDDNMWRANIQRMAPDVFIHCAWIGVEADDRNSWATQIRNIEFLMFLLDLATLVHLKQFLVLGSQAEYGNIDQKVHEDHPTQATTAYGAVKLACLEILKTYCGQKNIKWVWLRVFSLFGERENQNWLIPAVIKKMQISSEMDLTPGEQKYAYLYVKDFAKMIYKIIIKDIDPGVYNISSNKLHSLKSLIEYLKHNINPHFTLNFGALPYRDGQSMHIEGDISKITNQIGLIEFTDFNVALNNIINYYTLK